MIALDLFKDNILKIILIVLIITGGVLALSSFQEDILDTLGSGSITNESHTWQNNTYIPLSNDETLIDCSNVWGVLP